MAKRFLLNSFFAGIGGFDIGFERQGFRTNYLCEINPYCQAVLATHWPEVRLDSDICSLDSKNIPVAESEITMIPQTYVKLEGDNAEHMLKLLDELEEHDDVKDVYSNFDISKEDMEKYGA